MTDEMKIVRTAPQTIFLDVHGCEPNEDAFSDLDEVTWSSNDAMGDGIPYTRSDLARPALPERVAWSVALLESTLADSLNGGVEDGEHILDAENVRAVCVLVDYLRQQEQSDAQQQ